MALIIGMDEAGYGPNLGPLVVTATVWEVPGNPRKIDLWKEFDGVVAQAPADEPTHIQIADSKQVYNTARGLANLELGVLCALHLGGRTFRIVQELWGETALNPIGESDSEPWFIAQDLLIPHVANMNCAAPLLEKWQKRCDERGIRLKAVRTDIVLTRRFNRLTRLHQSKGLALSHISMELLRQAWSIETDESTLVIADKHGGRNFYQALLQQVVGDRFIFCRREETDASHYKIGQAEVRFEARAERHFPVALASMISKYFRELAMIQFNRYWTDRKPDLKPTAGYPGDAQRFRNDIADLQRELGIHDEVLWRER